MSKKITSLSELSSLRIEQKNVVTTIAYLIGVSEEYLKSKFPENQDIIDVMEHNYNAVIIRALCNIRTNLMMHFSITENNIVYNLQNLYMQELYKADFEILRKYDADITKTNCKVNDYLMIINANINKRIDTLKELFPEWFKWSYLRQLFVIPKGNDLKVTKSETKKFQKNINKYPFNRYIYWNPKDTGNILQSDKKFSTLIFEEHGQSFDDKSKVQDISEEVKTNIYDFIKKNDKIEIVVDCENSNPFKLAAVLKQLKSSSRNKITKVVLFDDIHTTKAWQSIDIYSHIPVEYHQIERIKENKSLVDIRMGMGISKSFYKDNVTAFILLSSDSDFWGVISSLDKADFLVMIEKEKCGPDIKNALQNNGTYYCYLDDFSTGNIKEFKNYILRNELEARLKPLVNMNVKDLVESIYTDLRMSDSSEIEKRIFIIDSLKILH